MDRGTKKFKTSGGCEVEIYTYITGGEFYELQEVFMKGANIKVGEEGKAEFSGFDPSLTIKANEKALELLVVSVDGSDKDKVQKLKDLPSSEFEEVVAEINKVKEGSDKKKEKE